MCYNRLYLHFAKEFLNEVPHSSHTYSTLNIIFKKDFINI
ncbi:hypothetical protein AMTRI_Chr11g156660 [Amborella trichopoda]